MILPVFLLGYFFVFDDAKIDWITAAHGIK
jgi:hypothetical protein